VRVVVADPPAFTPPYDHELSAALARAGASVELVTSHFRFGAVPPADGYERRELFYPLSSRLFRRSRLRLPLKALEHPFALTGLAALRPDVVHLQWLAWPQVDARLLRLRAPSVFTAHDLLPRRTARKTGLWRRLLQRFDRVVVHSERGRETLGALGVDARVIPHPVFRRELTPHGDGTVLFFGIIRPYRGLDDAVAAAAQTGARLIVAGDPVTPIERESWVDYRLGYLSEDEVDALHAEATVAVFPYRPELDQSGSLLRALGSGVPAVVYDVGGLAEPVERFGAGLVVPAGDVEALADGLRRVLEDPAPYRAGAERARTELTWDASAAAHLALYRELVQPPPPGRGDGEAGDRDGEDGPGLARPGRS
jgi:glycosyltransferase involved in cell wall biosynthesis